MPTECYYFLNYGKKMVAKQYEWLVADLEEANKEENRSKRPWVVLMGHRPMYCSGTEDADWFGCHFTGNITEIIALLFSFKLSINIVFHPCAILRMGWDYLW